MYRLESFSTDWNASVLKPFGSSQTSLRATRTGSLMAMLNT